MKTSKIAFLYLVSSWACQDGSAQLSNVPLKRHRQTYQHDRAVPRRRGTARSLKQRDEKARNLQETQGGLVRWTNLSMMMSVAAIVETDATTEAPTTSAAPTDEPTTTAPSDKPSTVPSDSPTDAPTVSAAPTPSPSPKPTKAAKEEPAAEPEISFTAESDGKGGKRGKGPDDKKDAKKEDPPLVQASFEDMMDATPSLSSKGSKNRARKLQSSMSYSGPAGYGFMSIQVTTAALEAELTPTTTEEASPATTVGAKGAKAGPAPQASSASGIAIDADSVTTSFMEIAPQEAKSKSSKAIRKLQAASMSMNSDFVLDQMSVQTSALEVSSEPASTEPAQAAKAAKASGTAAGISSNAADNLGSDFTIRESHMEVAPAGAGASKQSKRKRTRRVRY